MPEWMTYEAAGERFGMSTEGMTKRAARLGWKVQPPNAPGGKALVEIPDAAEMRPPVRPAGDRPDDLTDELRRRAEAAEAVANAEREARIAAEARAARAEGEAAGLRDAVRVAEALAGEAVQQAAKEAARAGAAEARVAEAQERAARGEGARDVLQAALDTAAASASENSLEATQARQDANDARRAEEDVRAALSAYAGGSWWRRLLYWQKGR